MNKYSSQDNDTKQDEKPGEFVIGLVTFIIFIIFMTAWMYFVPGN